MPVRGVVLRESTKLGVFAMCRRSIAVVLIGVFVLAGCTSTQRIRPAVPGQPPFATVQPGDSITVVTRSGQETSLIVQQVEGGTLVASDGRRFASSDLVRIEKKEFSGAKTAGLVAAIAGGVGLVVIAVGVWLGENSR